MVSRETLINAAMRSFAAQANVFLVKAASSQRQAGADGLVSSGGRKCPASEIQVCERQQREHLGPVLGDAAIAHLAVAELALHDTKHMLDFRAHLAEPVIAGTLAGRQPAAGSGLLLHRPEHARRLRGALLRVARVALVAIDRGVIIADQTVHHLRIVHVAARHAGGVHKAAAGIDAPRAPSCRSTIDCPSSRNASADRACPPRSWWTAGRRLMSHRRSCHRAATRRALRDTLLPLRTPSSSVHALRADAGSSRSSSRPGSDRVRVRDCRTRASTGYRTALPRRPDQTDCTTAAGSRCATSRRSETLDDRLEDPPSDNAVRSPPPALTTAPSPPSRLERRRALCASSCPHNLASRSSAARPYCRPRIKGAVCHDPEADQSFPKLTKPAEGSRLLA